MSNPFVFVLASLLGLIIVVLIVWLARERRRYAAARRRLETDVIDMSSEIRRRMEVFKRAEKVRLLNEERNRIMRDVHDGLGGMLIQAISLVEQEKCTPALQEVLSLALTDLRLIVDSLSPTDSRFCSLVANFRHLHDRMHVGHRCRYSWRIDSIDEVEIGPARALAVLRILQEALTNVTKHAVASEVMISISYASPHKLFLSINDNGVGVQEADPAGRGIASMRSRAAWLGGSLTIANAEPGTIVSLVLPVRQPPSNQDLTESVPDNL